LVFQRQNSIKINFKSALIAVCIISSLFPNGNPITIDGLFDDWQNVSLSYQDPQGDGADLDFADLKITYDNEFLFIYFSLHSGEFLLQDGNAVHLYIDADNNPETGHPVNGVGAELEWIFGDRSGSYYIMDGITGIDQNDLTLRMAPTITNNEFEIAIARTSYPLTMDGSQMLVQGKVMITDSGNNADQIPDGNGGVSFSIGEDYIIPPTPISFDKRHSTDIRLITHNVLSSNLMNPDYQEYFQRMYIALNPDIIALQEMYEHTNQLQSLISTWFPDDQWYTSSQFRDNIIISKYPILAQDFMTNSSRTMVALLGTENVLGSDLIIFNSHLACCANNESRQNDADEFAANWRDWRENGNGPFILTGNTPFVHVGDFNLVGNREQLITLTEGNIIDETTFGDDYPLDWDGTPIADLFSRHTHKRMGYTWRRDNSSFSPGKLDYILYTDSVLDTAKHFVLNTLTMDSASLSEYGLNAWDSYNSSDHLLRILDIAVPDQINVDPEHLTPTQIKISNPYPNPFNPSTTIQFELLTPGFINVDLFDLKGKFVKNISNNEYSSGQHEINVQGNNLTSGVYLIRINGQHFSKSFKILLLK
jgi:endonuclease/exonuclease/phosphatase family metal-dependent hydrolase